MLFIFEAIGRKGRGKERKVNTFQLSLVKMNITLRIVINGEVWKNVYIDLNVCDA